MANEKYVTLSEVKDLLSEVEEKTIEQKIAEEHAEQFAVLDAKKSRKLADKLAEIDYISDSLAVKITDLLPRTIDELRAVFAKERINLETGEAEKILSIVKEYL